MSQISKKRKRAAEDASEQVSIKIAQPTGKAVGPVLGAYYHKVAFAGLLIPPSLASFPAVQPPQSTPFQLYLKRGGKDASSAKDTLLVGETDTVEFVSSEEGVNATAGCRCVTCRPFSFILLINAPATM